MQQLGGYASTILGWINWRQNGQCTNAFCGSVFHLLLQKGHSTRTLSPTRNHLRLKAQTTPPKTMATMPKTNREISLKDTPRMKSNFSVQRRFQKADMKLSAEQIRSQILQNAMIIAEIPRKKRIRLRAYPNLLFRSTFFILILSLS